MKPWEKAAQSQVLAPTPTTGPPTSSAPANTVVGGGYFAATNMVTSQAAGGETMGLAAILTLWFEWWKKRPFFNQQEHAVLALLIFGLVLSLSYAGIAIYLAHVDLGKAILEAIPRAGAVAFQAQQNYFSARATGLGGFSPAATIPGGN